MNKFLLAICSFLALSFNSYAGQSFARSENVNNKLVNSSGYLEKVGDSPDVDSVDGDIEQHFFSEGDCEMYYVGGKCYLYRGYWVPIH